jgi:excisionase family DNA binding protein
MLSLTLASKARRWETTMPVSDHLKRNDMPLLLTIPEAALRLRCGRSMIYKLSAEKRLQLVKVGKLSRITSESTDRLVHILIREKENAD